MKLKECPFCGGGVKVYHGRPKMMWSISFVCKKCGFNISHKEYRTGDRESYDKKIYTAWNKRTK